MESTGMDGLNQERRNSLVRHIAILVFFSKLVQSLVYMIWIFCFPSFLLVCAAVRISEY